MKAVLQISGVVQGVGFRPFVARLAKEYGLHGFVKNSGGTVYIEAFGTRTVLDGFTDALKSTPPMGSFIAAFTTELFEAAQNEAPGGFSILQSDEFDAGLIMPSPDIAVCESCLEELFTPGDPRYKNPFISCTACGPRYSILQSIPYDRSSTSMVCFELCPHCAREYKTPQNRRFHAQTVCCNACGPTLFYESGGISLSKNTALEAATEALKNNAILAIKGIGGYHFACSPFHAPAVEALRTLKGREQKPFAVLFESLASLRLHCKMSAEEEALLTSPARPIVLLERLDTSDIAPEVYGTSRFIGAFLPYTPLHALLLKETGPLVLTSANLSGLPIFIDDAAMLDFFRKSPLLQGVLYHDRPIVRRLDDSVAAVIAGKTHMVRRARGYVPLPLKLNVHAEHAPLLACGAQEKSAFCLVRNGLAYMGAEAGSLSTEEAAAAYAEAISSAGQTLSIAPAQIVCDAHPLYESTRYAASRGLPLTKVQHHFAHIASVMAEHALMGDMLGAAFDGTGYGEDGAIWGGEFMHVQNGRFSRAGHLKAVKLLGSDDSVLQAWKSALCYLADAGLYGEARTHPYGAHFELISAALKANVNVVSSTSMGRAFDAASSLLGLCHVSGYDGQSAIELENAAARFLKTHGGAYPPPLPYALIFENGAPVIDLAPAFRELCVKMKEGTSADELAASFHAMVRAFTVEAFCALREKHGISDLALSGGVFHNRLLTEALLSVLAEKGFTVYMNESCPAGDGCIPLGQAYYALMTAQKE